MDKHERQLGIVRHAFQRVRFTEYVGMIFRGELEEERLAEKMRSAMENFDQLVDKAASGVWDEGIAKAPDHDFVAEFERLKAKRA